MISHYLKLEAKGNCPLQEEIVTIHKYYIKCHFKVCLDQIISLSRRKMYEKVYHNRSRHRSSFWMQR